jgi:hypothetical protein
MGAPRGTAHHACAAAWNVRGNSSTVGPRDERFAEVRRMNTSTCRHIRSHSVLLRRMILGNPWADEMTASSVASRSSCRKPRNLASHHAHVLDVNKFLYRQISGVQRGFPLHRYPPHHFISRPTFISSPSAGISRDLLLSPVSAHAPHTGDALFQKTTTS